MQSYIFIVAAILAYIIGALWYSPLFFGNVWARGMKFSKKDMVGMNKAWASYVGTFVCLLVVAFGMQFWLNQANVQGAVAGASLAFWIWLAFVATTQLYGVMWQKKPFNVYVIDVSGFFVQLVVMGAIVGAV